MLVDECDHKESGDRNFKTVASNRSAILAVPTLGSSASPARSLSLCKNRLGRQNSNLGMAESKPARLFNDFKEFLGKKLKLTSAQEVERVKQRVEEARRRSAPEILFPKLVEYSVPIPTKPPVYNGMIAPRNSWMMPPPFNGMIPPGPRLAERVFSPDVVSDQPF